MRLPGHRKKLLREGAQAQAVVTQCEGADLTHNGFSHWALVLEIHFEDGSTAEIRDKVSKTDVAPLLKTGDIVPVRYDPDDHSDAVVDTAATKAEADERQSSAQAAAVEQARRQLDG
jgi:Protein of unknown function (DUF3592)